jgi:hypothetical protein
VVLALASLLATPQSGWAVNARKDNGKNQFSWQGWSEDFFYFHKG